MIGKVDTNHHTGSSQFKMLALCLICTVVYVYLYTNIALKTEIVSILVKRAIVDLEDWTKNLKVFRLYSSDKVVLNAITITSHICTSA
jgi:hypothetical protein